MAGVFTLLECSRRPRGQESAPRLHRGDSQPCHRRDPGGAFYRIRSIHDRQEVSSGRTHAKQFSMRWIGRFSANLIEQPIIPQQRLLVQKYQGDGGINLWRGGPVWGSGIASTAGSAYCRQRLDPRDGRTPWALLARIAGGRPRPTAYLCISANPNGQRLPRVKRPSWGRIGPSTPPIPQFRGSWRECALRRRARCAALRFSHRGWCRRRRL